MSGNFGRFLARPDQDQKDVFEATADIRVHPRKTSCIGDAPPFDWVMGQLQLAENAINRR